MRTIKIILWIFILYILQTVFGSVIAIRGTVPYLLLAFAIVFSFREWSMAFSSYVFIACGIIAGSEAGGYFPAVMLVTGIGGIIAHSLAKYIRFVPGFLRTVLVTAVCTGVISAVKYFGSDFSADIVSAATAIVPQILYTGVCMLIMYPLMVRTLFRKTEKKLLVI